MQGWTKTRREDRLCDPEAVRGARAFLEEYRRATDMLSLLECEYADRNTLPAAGFSAARAGRMAQKSFWEGRAQAVCDLIDALPPYREKMMLHYHYLLGYSVEATAEAMDISRSAAFRLKKRALEMVAMLLSEQERLGA
jgi:DNA-directed RNA polymerase specialized sigma24 family protein